jgi:hypothetical protein
MACRSLDLWPVAPALHAEADRFVTFDTNQFTLAKTEGLTALVPP